MTRFVRVSALLAVTAAVAVASVVSASASAPVQSAGGCGLGGGYRLGSTYVTSLSVKGTSCRNGKRVVNAFHSCRKSHGARGRCGHRVRGYRCHEGRRRGISTQYSGSVTCKRGGKRVRSHYTQNT
jgi:hypothetical protein